MSTRPSAIHETPRSNRVTRDQLKALNAISEWIRQCVGMLNHDREVTRAIGKLRSHARKLTQLMTQIKNDTESRLKGG